jgi:hypothetical protein
MMQLLLAEPTREATQQRHMLQALVSMHAAVHLHRTCCAVHMHVKAAACCALLLFGQADSIVGRRKVSRCCWHKCTACNLSSCGRQQCCIAACSGSLACKPEALKRHLQLSQNLALPSPISLHREISRGAAKSHVVQLVSSSK